MQFLGLSIGRANKPASPVIPPIAAPKVRKNPSLAALKKNQARSISQAAGNSRLESSWTTFPEPADAVIYREWITTVARSRQIAKDADHGKKFLQLVRDNVAGPTGFTLQAQIEDTPGGKLDSLASRAIETAYAEFSRRGNFDASGTMSRKAFERLWVQTKAVNGEAIAVIERGKDAGPWNISLRMMDPMLMDPRYYQKAPNGNTIRHGIEFNASGRPVAYHFRDIDDSQSVYLAYSNYASANYTRIPAEDVIHEFLPEEVGAKRGMPWMRTAMWRMRMLQGFEDSAITTARVGAAKGGFFTDEDGEPQESDEPITMDAEPGVFEQLPAGYKFQEFNPQYPSDLFDPFFKACLRSISSGLSVSYNNLASDLTSVNFSSIRQGAMDEREVWKGLQEHTIETLCDRTFDEWLKVALIQGRIKVNGKPLRFEQIEKYRNVTFSGRRWGWIDPVAEMTANEKAIGQKLKSRSEIIRDMGNRDPQDVWNEIEREDAVMEQLGIEPLNPAGSAPPVPDEPDPKTE